MELPHPGTQMIHLRLSHRRGNIIFKNNLQIFHLRPALETPAKLSTFYFGIFMRNPESRNPSCLAETFGPGQHKFSGSYFGKQMNLFQDCQWIQGTASSQETTYFIWNIWKIPRFFCVLGHNYVKISILSIIQHGMNTVLQKNF